MARRRKQLIMKYALILLLLLASCTKEYSAECQGCQTTTTFYVNGAPSGSTISQAECGNVPRDTIYFIGMVTAVQKTICK